MYSKFSTKNIEANRQGVDVIDVTGSEAVKLQGFNYCLYRGCAGSVDCSRELLNAYHLTSRETAQDQETANVNNVMKHQFFIHL